ncbi:hypothetical protein LINPERPRIM_LOCUS2325 [Linum perenne]
MISDSISLFAASTYVLMFLGILTSRFAEADFLWSVPTKLVIGLSTLFISIAAMMVTFYATVMIAMDKRLEYVVPIILLASVPEVERIINPMYKDNTNNNNETSSHIFTRTHKVLASAGEKWMKKTASSSTVVGALIITIMFTAAFTILGGNNQETDIQILLHKKAIKIFMISDSISLFAASTYVLMFLGILTSRYAEADFLWSLPTKLVIGLSTLFISIAAMMVTFYATVMIAMDKRLEYVVPIILLASVPEVERIINPMYKDNTNNSNETSSHIFTRTHKVLASAGEKWMKKTASSSTVVGALIITIMFTAAFTILGGNNQETDIQILLHKMAIKIFMISDSISLFAASTYVLMFLGILTSRYAEADFLWSLPTKLVIGLSTLFISIAAMMVTFYATVMIAMDKRLEYVVPIIILASVPVLASAGEKWMKKTASSSTVVGALIITIMFTAAFTILGGNNQETDIQILLHKKAIKIFMISDSISLFAASTYVLMFLGILTSRYAEADFLWSLPTKLVIGLSTLFIPIAAMMLTFCATDMIAMDKRLEYVVPIILLASVPVLASAGEKLMKENASSSTIVRALIITIMFTAAFAIPGGNNQEIDIPILPHEKAIKIFMISDSISLFATSTYVLMFLGILTSRYAEADFLWSLPTKLVIGLSTLFISIAAMMLTFCATVMIAKDK